MSKLKSKHDNKITDYKTENAQSQFDQLARSGGDVVKQLILTAKEKCKKKLGYRSSSHKWDDCQIFFSERAFQSRTI